MKLTCYFDAPFVFILKCDFEPKVASISDKATPLMIEADSVVFEKDFSPVEFLKPDAVETVIENIIRKVQ